MTGTPDFQRSSGGLVGDIANLVVLVGAGSVAIGTFRVGGETGIQLGLKAAVGDIDLQLIFTAEPASGSADYRPVFSVGVGETLWQVLPPRTFGSLEGTASGDVAGTTAGIYLTSLPLWLPGGGAASASALAFNAGVAVAAGGTHTQRLAAFAGRATLNVILPGTPWVLRIDSEDRAGVVVAEPFRRTATAGELTQELVLPPRINVLRATNNSALPQTLAYTIIPWQDGRY